VKSSVGRSMAAMRDDELVCQAFGVNVWRAKIILGTVVGGGIGLAGALYVLIIGITSPTTVDVYLSIYLLISMVVGGARTLWGPALGGVFLQFFPIWTSGFFERSPELILGIVLILIVCVAPEGIAGSLKSYSGELRQRLAPSG
jgi:branched-chain amino acid transport system permease protein